MKFGTGWSTLKVVKQIFIWFVSVQYKSQNDRRSIPNTAKSKSGPSSLLSKWEWRLVFLEFYLHCPTHFHGMVHKYRNFYQSNTNPQFIHTYRYWGNFFSWIHLWYHSMHLLARCYVPDQACPFIEMSSSKCKNDLPVLIQENTKKKPVDNWWSLVCRI